MAGFSFSGAASNGGLMFARLKPFEEREGPEHSLDAVLGRVRGQAFGIPGALVIPVAPPAIQGISAFGGFQFEVLDLTGGDITNLQTVTQQVAAAGNRSGRVAGLFSSFTANDPQLVVEIDRDRARSLGLPIREVTDALAVLLGSQYVNDFDFNNRAYRVYVQGDQAFRAKPSDLKQYYARASNGDMVPLSTVVRLSERTAPAVINHFNLFRSTEITGAAAAGRQLGSGAAGDAAHRGRHAAGGLRLRLGGLVARRDQSRVAGGSTLRAQHRARVSRAGGAVRELGAAVHHSAGRARWRCSAR